MEETTENLKDIAKDKNIEISIDGKQVIIYGVRKLLYEIIYNLCDNAIKYNIYGGNIKISITKNNQNAVLTVADTGIGIPQEHLDRVFERFYRVDKARSRDKGGNGLGLSIARRLIEGYHGKLVVESAVGQGSVFRVSLPLVKNKDNKK